MSFDQVLIVLCWWLQGLLILIALWMWSTYEADVLSGVYLLEIHILGNSMTLYICVL